MTEEKKLEIREDITTWGVEAESLGFFPGSEDEIVDGLHEGLSTAQAARATLASRAMKKSPEEILPPNTLLLQIGAMGKIGQIIRKKKEPFIIHGKTYQAPAYVGRVTRNPDTEPTAEEVAERLFEAETEMTPQYTKAAPSYVVGNSQEGARRAEEYLENVVPGHIWKHLLIIAQNGGDVELASVKLKLKISDMIDKLK